MAFVFVLISILKVRTRSTSRKEVIRRQGTRRRHGDDATAATTTTTTTTVTTTTRRRSGGGIDVKFSWTSDTARRLLHYKSRAAVAAPTLLPPTLPRSIPNAGQVSPPNICSRTPAPKIDIADIYPLDLMELTLTLNITLTTNTTLTSINPTLTLLP